ncbi:hypothetical protein BDV25DRAFT_140632 [Aspergillus avenaceus]|uniref:Uncharacterized protein n=1 Tax=Aspergillus avenaceus TaxID=36643 RepID=A0A5N6TTA7_ASPAV|nr:hypothetical protein BDV25DRAFT_140632 [Aspergillus avenaceus]
MSNMGISSLSGDKLLEFFKINIVNSRGGDIDVAEHLHPWMPSSPVPTGHERGDIPQYSLILHTDRTRPVPDHQNSGLPVVCVIPQLSTQDERKMALLEFASYGMRNREYRGPLIIGQTDLVTFVDLFHHEKEKGNRPRVTMVNNNFRLRCGLPILNMWEEMDHYEVFDKAQLRGADEDYRNSAKTLYFYPYTVTKREIVSNWDCDEFDDLCKEHLKISGLDLHCSLKDHLAEMFRTHEEKSLE